MQAIEFTAKAKDGVIKIPPEYLVDIHGELRIIILLDSPVAPQNKKRKFTALKLKTKNLKFDREEANER